MSRDGGLPGLFKKNLVGFHVVSVETWSTGQGVPDLNYCGKGNEGWVELKQTSTNKVGLSPEQVGWIERRVRAGGRVFIAVRKHRAKSPRIAACDELHFFRGRDVRSLLIDGLGGPSPLACWTGGPRAWDWDALRFLLRGGRRG